MDKAEKVFQDLVKESGIKGELIKSLPPGIGGGAAMMSDERDKNYSAEATAGGAAVGTASGVRGLSKMRDMDFGKKRKLLKAIPANSKNILKMAPAVSGATGGLLAAGTYAATKGLNSLLDSDEKEK